MPSAEYMKAYRERKKHELHSGCDARISALEDEIGRLRSLAPGDPATPTLIDTARENEMLREEVKRLKQQLAARPLDEVFG